jgi:hypothetical protein
MPLFFDEERMLDALAVHEAAHAVVDTVLGLSVHFTFIDPITHNGRTEYDPALSKAIEVLLLAPALDAAMISLAERVGIATAAGYVAEACHRGVRCEAICLTPNSPGFSDREKMKRLCSKLQTREDAQFTKWEEEAKLLVTRYAPEIRALADELRKKLCLSGDKVQCSIRSAAKRSRIPAEERITE